MKDIDDSSEQEPLIKGDGVRKEVSGCDVMLIDVSETISEELCGSVEHEIFEQFPLEIKQRNGCGVWRAIPEKGGKIKKVPWRPDGSGRLEWSDTGNLMCYQDAVATYYSGREHGIKFDGIGFILPSDSDLIVIDLDDAFDADGNLKEAANKILEYFSSYAEISPSGKGLHIWIRARITGPNVPRTFIEGQSIEMFTHDHFATITGDVITGYEVFKECQEKADKFYQLLKEARKATSEQEPGPSREASADDRLQRYVMAALQSELDAVRKEQKGNRNNRLNRAAFKLGRLVGGGYLSMRDVERELLQAAKHVGLPEDEARATMKSGLEAGKKDPRDLGHGGGKRFEGGE